MTEQNLIPSSLNDKVEYVDPLYLDLPNAEFVQTIKDNIKQSVKYYETKRLKERQDKNVRYYKGDQPLPIKLKSKQFPYMENIVYEAISRIKPIELGRMPDITVKAGSDDPNSKDCAEKLTGIFNSDLKKRSNRRLLGLCAKQEPLYFFSVVKARWNPELGEFGDYEFVNVHPQNIVFDHTVNDSDPNKMRFIAEKQQLTIKEMIMMFPHREKEIKLAFGWTSDTDDEKMLATKDDCYEVWFHWYKQTKEEGESKWERVDGTVWMYKDLILDKIKNPYFDFQGKKRTFNKKMKEKQAFGVDEIFTMLNTEEETVTETIYNNYFTMPEKPYFFFVYENMGEHPIGETSRVEQVLEFQDAINQGGAQILDMNLRSRGKDIIDTNALDQETIEKIDIYNVDEVLGIDVPAGSSINAIHSHFDQPPATQQMYRSMDDNRRKAFEMLAVGATTRGVRDQDSTLGESQMAREADYGVIDDIVEDTINACAEWQARWSMQMVKLFYTKPHMRHILGKDGEVLHEKLSRDLVDNGMEAIVSASGVDKMNRKRMAVENMKLGIGDPLSYYEDTEQDNPKERAMKAMMAQGSPQMYIQQYLMPKPAEGEEKPAQTDQGMAGQTPDPTQAAMAASPGAPPASPPPMGVV